MNTIDYIELYESGDQLLAVEHCENEVEYLDVTRADDSPQDSRAWFTAFAFGRVEVQS